MKVAEPYGSRGTTACTVPGGAGLVRGSCFAFDRLLLGGATPVASFDAQVYCAVERVPTIRVPTVSDPRIIKKYPNRRLYDTTVSSYITLEDVRKLVLDTEDFCVIDARSKEDITRSILLQIILEQEEDGNPIFSEQVLSQVIRFYGDALQGTLTSYLDRSFGLFVEQQKSMQEQMQSLVTTDPMSFMRSVAEKNMSLWNDMQESFRNATAAGSGFAKKPGDNKKP